METNPSYEEQIARLENDLQSRTKDLQKYSQELEKLKQQYAEDLFAERQIAKCLHQERHQLQQDYEQLRVQKGGFGLKALLLSGWGGFVTALILCVLYIVLVPIRSDQQRLFEQFRHANQFNYERAISEGRFEDVENGLERQLSLPYNKPIYPQLEFTRKIVGAARRRCEE